MNYLKIKEVEVYKDDKYELSLNIIDIGDC